MNRETGVVPETAVSAKKPATSSVSRQHCADLHALHAPSTPLLLLRAMQLFASPNTVLSMSAAQAKPVATPAIKHMLSAGLGLKPAHYADALSCTAAGLWWEVHPENYLTDGGPRLAWLEAIRQHHPISLHGVSLSLAADASPDTDHLERLKQLVQRIEPTLVSEHLAWSQWRGQYHPDLLPFIRTQAVLARIASNISQTQDALGRTIAIENPTHYLNLAEHDWSEPEFLAELVRRTGCTLLLDINNVYISANNMGTQPQAYLDAFALGAVSEIHLAGHHADPEHGNALLIDSHDAPVIEAVWDLYAYTIAKTGPVPTLIERDDQLPPLAELLAEQQRAHHMLCPL